MTSKERSTPCGWSGIIRSLDNINVPRDITSVIRSYFSNRCTIIENVGEKLEKILGPILWNIAFDKLLKEELPDLVEVVAFADDVAFTIKGNTRRQLEYTGDRVC